MRVVMFYHSVLSDWNHGNAHFLRGVATELISRGHDVLIYEEHQAWSLKNLMQEQGDAPLHAFHSAYPEIRVVRYNPDELDLRKELSGADAVIVHEWNSPSLVSRIGLHRKNNDHYILFFHDTHHRCVTDPKAMANYDLRHYDGVLAYGASIRDVYVRNGWATEVHVWHEAADARVFNPGTRLAIAGPTPPNGAGKSRAAQHHGYDGDLVWIGNWGDDERVEEIREFLIEPVKQLGLRARVYGVRYPASAITALQSAGIEYGGWLPNFCVPQVFSRFRVTVHIQRNPYTHTLRGIPTIRPFEAMACGIPLVSSPWDDAEKLFTAGKDYLVARDTSDMVRQLKSILDDPAFAQRLAVHARCSILERHTCGHRVDQLLAILQNSPVLAQRGRS